MEKIDPEKFNSETAEYLREVLKEIGCKNAKEWLKEKRENGEKVETSMGMGEACSIGSIVAAESIVSQFLSDNENAIFAISKMNDGGNYSWLQTWLRNSKKLARENKGNEKLFIPYYKVAKQALMNWGNEQSNYSPIPEEEADKIIKNSSFEEINSQVGAKKSMDYAIKGILEYLDFEEPMKETEEELLANAIYKNPNDSLLSFYKSEYIDKKGIDTDDLIISTLSAVHDGWVKDNSKKFFAREKNINTYQ